MSYFYPYVNLPMQRNSVNFVDTLRAIIQSNFNIIWLFPSKNFLSYDCLVFQKNIFFHTCYSLCGKSALVIKLQVFRYFQNKLKYMNICYILLFFAIYIRKNIIINLILDLHKNLCAVLCNAYMKIFKKLGKYKYLNQFSFAIV